MGVCLMTIPTGCSDNIDIDPSGIVTADGYFKSETDYDNAMNGVYGMINADNNDLWMDAVTDNGLVTHSWNKGYDLGRGIGNSSSSFPSTKWRNGYTAVQRVNNVIGNIDTYEWTGGESNSSRRRVLGEALTMRAYFYLDLVGTFGNILYYNTNPATVDEAREMTQAKPKEVFDGILKDLEQAVSLLPEGQSSKSRVSKAAARLLRARAAAYAAGYLNDKSYFNITLTETDALLQNAPALANNYGDLFKSGCESLSEVILVRTYSEDSKNWWGDWYNQSIGGYCVTTPVKALADAYEYVGGEVENRPYEHKDARFYETIYAPGMTLRGSYYNTIPGNVVTRDGATYFDPSKDYGDLQDRPVVVGDVLAEGGGGEWNKTPTGLAWKKYFSEQETWSTMNAFVVLRYAEAYLLRAEALVETGGSEAEAKQLIQVVRQRAGNTNDIDEAVASIYGGSLLNLIRNERRVEMADENVRFFDIRRWGILLDVMNKPVEGVEYRDFSSGTPQHKVLVPATRTAYTAKDFYWPIPQEEMDLSKGNLVQNEGW